MPEVSKEDVTATGVPALTSQFTQILSSYSSSMKPAELPVLTT